jgi:hypothetical protein
LSPIKKIFFDVSIKKSFFNTVCDTLHANRLREGSEKQWFKEITCYKNSSFTFIKICPISDNNECEIFQFQLAKNGLMEAKKVDF